MTIVQIPTEAYQQIVYDFTERNPKDWHWSTAQRGDTAQRMENAVDNPIGKQSGKNGYHYTALDADAWQSAINYVRNCQSFTILGALTKITEALASDLNI